ncbi:2-hydroxy-3-oxopropionate reductase [Leifsonia sp. LS1]|uniref:NAD(P)-dependent oxidoreductase n=1 Tax=Leifsonia sp. LS1 TaxID=2828483 RepID=UPI001CFE9B13|nr:NAD(P)-dependent oxidoreductase [Leifsonia sp. LS1]GIT81225.1 2-hydroxy-3-oxopropionate reductase [Leifsonia sp. LS1]
MHPSPSPVGFAGLGIMGRPMAANLRAAGTDLVVWNRSDGPAAELAALGAAVARDPGDLFARCRVVILMLATEAAIDATLDRNGDVFPERVAGHVVVQMGTVTPAYSRALSADIAAAGGSYVEAPVSGSRGPAVEGTLVAMLAGPDDALAEIAPLVDAMCAQRFACGPVPAALTMKLAVNTFLITMVTGLAEAFHFADVVGADTRVLREVLDAGPMASAVSRVKSAKLVDGDFSPQAAIGDVLKNATLIEDAALDAGSAHPLIAVCRELFAETAASGRASDDMAAVVTALTARAPGR